MDISIILTYRCDSKCSMCYIWKNPTLPNEEVALKTIEKLPNNFDNLNITGGEPTLRTDLPKIVDLVYKKGKIIEISTNGLHTEKILPIIKKYPNIKVRYSVEAIGDKNNIIRGEEGGFATKVEGLKKLKENGGLDLGFATVIQDDNIDDLMKVYKLSCDMGVELATSTLHNAFQFHKNDNYFYERKKVAKEVENLVTALLKTSSVKNWFRAYLNLGLIEKILGHDRLIPCTAATDFIFVDPWSDVYACNVRPDLLMGNLEKQSWDEIVNGKKAEEIRNKVAQCTQNCWMVTTARTAMRNPFITFLPKLGPLRWVILNKIKASLGININFENYINYNKVEPSNKELKRESYLGLTTKRNIQSKNEKHYNMGDFINR
jgi:MoaA/NifB/PqqE/SkfB family radical SAM enzyme